MMDAAKYETYVAQPVEDNPAEFDEPENDEVEHDEIREEPIMRNPFARRKPAPAPERIEPVAASAGIGEVGIESAAEMLIAGGATRAIFVSPEGDEGAAAAVMVAREVADAGLRVLLLDLTASGAASRPDARQRRPSRASPIFSPRKRSSPTPSTPITIPIAMSCRSAPPIRSAP